MEFIKKYIADILVLFGVLLITTNYYFKFTKYSILSIKDEIMLDLSTIEYDYIGFISSIIIIIGLYIGIRRYLNKNS